MNDLDKAKEWIAQGENANAIGLLASMLLKNKNNVDAWLLLGDLLDDPSRKKDCYRWALKLCPGDVQIRTKLQELEAPPVPVTAVSPAPESSVVEPDTRPTLRSIPKLSLPVPAPASQPKSGMGIIGYVAGGVAVFLLILYLIANPDKFSTEILNVALVFMVFLAGIIILSAMNQNRS